MGQISKIFHWRVHFPPKHKDRGLEYFRPGIFTNFGRPLTENFSLVFLTSVRLELGIAFWGATKWVKFPIFRPRRENFAPEHDTSGLESILPGNFTHFGRPMVENYDLVVLTVVRVNGCFDHRATKICVRSFWPTCDQELFLKGAINGGLKSLAWVSKFG